jgi:hypothetical protein
LQACLRYPNGAGKSDRFGSGVNSMNRKSLNKIITVLIPVFVLLLFFIRDHLISFASHLPPCPFYSVYHLYCPACGNTRSVAALLHGDIAESLRFNIIPILYLILLLLAYIEYATYSFGRHILLLPRSLRFYITLIALIVIYVVFRNFIPYLTP